MDLFIIVAAVLGVGGIVTASIYSLVDSATANASISVVGASVKAGPGQSDPPTAISVSIKNNGGSPIVCKSSTCQVVFPGTNTGASNTPGCISPCSIVSGGGTTWSVGGPAGPASRDSPLTFVPSPFTLAPGAQTSFLLDGPLNTTSSASFWTSGTSVTISVLFGSSAVQVAVTSQ